MTWMQWLEEGGKLLLLSGMAGIDLRDRRVPNRLLGLFLLWTLFCSVCYSLVGRQPETLQFLFLDRLFALCAMLPVLLLTYRIARHALGGGDAKLILCLACGYGLLRTLSILLLAAAGCGLVGGLGILCKKWSWKSTVPFVPFVWGAVLLDLLRSGLSG